MAQTGTTDYEVKFRLALDLKICSALTLDITSGPKYTMHCTAEVLERSKVNIISKLSIKRTG